MTDQPEKMFWDIPDPSLEITSGKDGQIYVVTQVGIGQAMSEEQQATWVVTVTAENVNGDEVIVVLLDPDILAIIQAAQRRDRGFS